MKYFQIGHIGVGKTTLLQVLSGELVCPKCQVQTYGELAYLQQMETVRWEADADGELLGRLGVRNVSLKNMSGGEAIRYRIANLLSRNVHGILADEPTCNIDRDGISCLIDRFRQFHGALIIVSQDRDFLDALVHKIWELKEGKLTEYLGNYTEYQYQLDEKRRSQEIRYSVYIQNLERLTHAYEDKRKKAARASQKPNLRSGKNNIPDRNGMTKSFGSREKTLYRSTNHVLNRMNSLDKVEKPDSVRGIGFLSVPELTLHNKLHIWSDCINKAYGEKVLFENARLRVPLGTKVAITGSNGTGETTLWRMIVEGESGILISKKARIGYLSQDKCGSLSDENLLHYVMQDSHCRESELRSMLASLGFSQNDLKKGINHLSGGERVKCELCKVFGGRHNILILDEPSNYLDLCSVLALEEFMRGYHGTILFATHDARFVEHTADIVYVIQDRKLIAIKDQT